MEGKRSKRTVGILMFWQVSPVFGVLVQSTPSGTGPRSRSMSQVLGKDEDSISLEHPQAYFAFLALAATRAIAASPASNEAGVNSRATPK